MRGKNKIVRGAEIKKMLGDAGLEFAYRLQVSVVSRAQLRNVQLARLGVFINNCFYYDVDFFYTLYMNKMMQFLTNRCLAVV